ncbi:MAG: hypothetical protein KDA45_06405 [Planctomycetales bacterium]|nr:hypothetical protein [Planctomycetales bacterium]
MKVQQALLIVFISLWSAAARESRLCGSEPDLFTQLSEQGLSLGEQATWKLPGPTLAQDQSPEQRNAALETLAGKQGWARFARNSIMAPVAVDIEALQDKQGNRWGHDIHTAFMVHADLQQFRQEDLLEQLLGPPPTLEDPSTGGIEALSAEELRAVGISLPADSNESYVYIELPLLNKIIVRGVLHLAQRERAGAYEVAWQLDPRFSAVEKYAPRWHKLERNAVGRPTEGPAHPYLGLAGRVGVYQLDTAPSQLLVESRMLLREPEAWFAGSQFLRSKLPLSVQENARRLRRKLAP